MISKSYRLTFRPAAWRGLAFATSAVALSAIPTLAVDTQGPSSSQEPYVVSLKPDVSTTSLLSVGDSVNLKANGQPYRFVGIPDGMGAFDNGDGTFTALVNHELRGPINETESGAFGAVRDHGASGAFVSKWTIRKSDLAVVQGEDLIQLAATWDRLNGRYNPLAKGVVFQRFCSADLAEQSAFYSGGVGYRGRLFMNGEETGAEGRAFAHTMDGFSFELPRVGKFSWENSLANPGTGLKTVVAGTDDATPGQVYIYIGQKQNSGTPVDRAGLTNGLLYGVKVDGVPVESRSLGVAPNTRFSLAPMGNVENETGAQLQAKSVAEGVTEFLRPEDGHWDPKNPTHFYFATTDRFDSIKNPGTPVGQVGRSRLYRLRFDDINDLTKGGVVDTLLDGTERQEMMDNLTISSQGEAIIQEDPGNQAYLAKINRYNIASDTIEAIAEHNPKFFAPGAPNLLTTDEESSGVIDISDILGRGAFLINVQAHNATNDAFSTQNPELVERGQLLVLRVPPPNQAPTAIADSYEATEDSALTIAAPGVLANDTDIDLNTTLTATVATQPANGTLVLNANGSFTYTPRANFVGADSFSYRASDGTTESAPVTVSLNVRGSNDAPQINVPLAQSVAEEGTLTLALVSNNAISVSDVDEVPMRVQIDISSPDGTLTLAQTDNLDLNGSSGTGQRLVFEGLVADVNKALDGLRFVPRANFNGTARIAVSVSEEGAPVSDSDAINVAVSPVNDAPLAVADSANIREETPATLQVLANDSDVDGNALRVSEVDVRGTSGTVAISANGQSVVFTPSNGFNGSTSFGYTISDGTLTSTARVSVQVLEANDAPVAVADFYTVPSTGTRTLQVYASNGVLRNDTDAEGNTLRASVVVTPRRGELVFNTDGSFTYTPSRVFSGRDTFAYFVTDGKANSNLATVTITIPQPRDTTPPVVFLGGASRSQRVLSTPRGVAVDVYAVGGIGVVPSSGLRNVTLTLQRADGQFWNGRAFQAARFELPTRLTGRAFSYAGALPVGAQAPQGRYTWTAIARDNAGNTSRATQIVTIDSLARG